MMNIYEMRRYGTLVFILASILVVAGFLYVSGRLVDDLSEQERERMQIWADATREIVSLGSADIQTDESGNPVSAPEPDIDFLLSIIKGNRNIPVLLTDDDGVIITHRNFDLPEPVDSLNPLYISEANRAYLIDRLNDLRSTGNVIHIIIAPGHRQHLYYAESRLLRSLRYYPYIQLLVMLAFIAVVYFAVLSTKKAEQNKVWVGLSKETAHQLGTPISSLMAWMDYLSTIAPGSESAVTEMEKDVSRLAAIASRFSKIGSRPGLEEGSAGEVMVSSADYMRKRVSEKVVWTVDDTSGRARVAMCAPLLEWVMENLIKNAVDAMGGQGRLTLVCSASSTHISIEVTDTGCGIARRDFRRIFQPGFTTRRRGWGLGLTLARRIVESYHHGRIYVRASEPGRGTTFRIDLPRTDTGGSPIA